jgi:hypothetical protein
LLSKKEIRVPQSSRPILVAAALAIAIGCHVHANAGDLTVIEAVWTTSVTARQYGRQVEPDAPARPLYFWTKLAGGQEALEILRQQGKLPIKHHWKFTNVFDASAEDQDPEQESAKYLPAGDIRDQGGMAALVNDGKNFTWRTWTHKKAVWGGTWTVTVVYSDGSPVLCESKPCSWSISLGD